MNLLKRTLLCLFAAGLILVVVYIAIDGRNEKQAVNEPSEPVPVEPTASREKPVNITKQHETAPDRSDDDTLQADARTQTYSQKLVQAEEALARNQIYEDTAWTTLPLLSLQTHNPVWALDQGNKDSMRAPEAGAFGKLQPPEGEIWLRIPPDHAEEHLDIMAQNADLYRAETGYDGPVTVTLWVGGRIYRKLQYE